MNGRLSAVVAATLAFAGAGCQKKEHCERLVQLACDHVLRQTNGQATCDQIRENAKTVEDEQCQKTLRLLKESGKLEQSSGASP